MKPTGAPTRNRSLALQNRQRSRKVDVRHFRRIATHLLDDLLELDHYELTVLLVGTRKMTRLNTDFLQHEGSTDVITFDYSDSSQTPGAVGEIAICVDEAVVQARRWRTSWQAEVTRYLVHGVLHLLGYDDQDPPSRRRMKSEENRVFRALSNAAALSKLQAADRI